MNEDLRVAIAGCDTYDLTAVTRETRTVWEALGMPDLKGATVLVKPNILTDAAAQKAVTTHPVLVEAVCRIIQEQGGSPIVGDSPGLQRSGFSPTACGIADVCTRLGVPWVDFTSETVTIRNPRGQVQRRFTVTSAVESADYIVNLPKMKTHQLMYATGAIKNLFGLIPGLSKSPFHLKYPQKEAFAHMILDLYQSIPTEIHIMDAITAMEGPGPSGGFPKRIGMIAASKNAIALDLSISYLMHEQPAALPILSCAYERGMISTLDHNDLIYPLARPQEFRPEHFSRIERDETPKHGFVSVIGSHVKTLFSGSRAPAPRIVSERCILCRACVEICPADALSVEPNPESGRDQIVVNTRDCIRCYCCHEVCPVRAIIVKSS